MAIDEVLEAILERVRELRSFDFRSYKRATLNRRVERRVAEREVKSTGIATVVAVPPGPGRREPRHRAPLRRRDPPDRARRGEPSAPPGHGRGDGT